MFLQWLWFLMMAGSVIYACATGRGADVLPVALEGAKQSIEVTIRLGAGYLFFGGLMGIAQGTGVTRTLEKTLKPMFGRLMPHMHGASEMVAMNLSMNVLGLGNAATPAGVEAMRMMEAERRNEPKIKYDMYMFLILNATSLQLLPTTVLTLRTAAGSLQPNAVLLPTLACTALSTLVGAVCGVLCRRWEERKNAR